MVSDDNLATPAQASLTFREREALSDLLMKHGMTRPCDDGAPDDHEDYECREEVAVFVEELMAIRLTRSCPACGGPLAQDGGCYGCDFGPLPDGEVADDE